jgi:exodeoxyribonuclease VII large subunit
LRHASQAKAIALARAAPLLRPDMLRQRVRELDTRLHQLAGRAPRALANSAGRARLRFDPVAGRLTPAFARILATQSQRLQALDKLLVSLSYENVLARGYALVRRSDGVVVAARAGLNPGDTVDLQFADGEVGATISGAPAMPRRKPRSQSDKDSQESLF